MDHPRSTLSDRDWLEKLDDAPGSTTTTPAALAALHDLTIERFGRGGLQLSIERNGFAIEISINENGRIICAQIHHDERA